MTEMDLLCVCLATNGLREKEKVAENIQGTVIVRTLSSFCVECVVSLTQVDI